MYAEVAWVLVSSGTQVQVSYDYGQINVWLVQKHRRYQKVFLGI